MKSKELWITYQEYTHDLTEYGRKLGFAGVAICWIFKKQNDLSFTFPLIIYYALFSFVIYFIFDILQNFVGLLVLKIFIEGQESKLWKETGSIEGEIDKPRSVDNPAFICFLFKYLSLFVGFVFIGRYIISSF